RDVLADRRPGQGVAEAVPRARGGSLIGLDDLLMDTGFETPVNVGLRHSRELYQRLIREGDAEHRPGAEDVDVDRVEAVEAAQDAVGHGLRQLDAVERLDLPPGPVVADRTLVNSVLEQLLEDKGVALGALAEQ